MQANELRKLHEQGVFKDVRVVFVNFVYDEARAEHPQDRGKAKARRLTVQCERLNLGAQND